MKPKCLDLFCKAGGMSMGYHQAGFDVVGVDIEYQKNYPFDFILSDVFALNIEWMREFDLISASPPCQHYSELTPIDRRRDHPDLIGPVREILIRAGRPYVIENVETARYILKTPVKLCGTMFGLNLYRHRYFEIPWLDTYLLPPCNHKKNPVVISGRGMRMENGRRWLGNTTQERREAMGVEWMVDGEIDEAIPPAYSRWIGERFLEQIR